VSRRTLRLSETDRQHLIAGAAALGIVLDREAIAQFARFADFLDVWAPKMNLLSCGSGRELVERHFLDSLAAAPVIPDSGLMVDLGTGAGFPGIPLALLRPQQPWLLVECRRRRTTFLREVRRALDLRQVEILEQRAEAPPEARTGKGVGVVTRAVWADTRFCEIAARWVLPDGSLFWMRSEPWPAGAATPGFRRDGRMQYRIGEQRLRTIEVLRRLPVFHVEQF
jgi:16S rRNA (guanine527-N7)-methyltransferase